MLNRNAVLKSLLVIVDSFFTSVRRLSLISRMHITKAMKRLSSQEFIYFTKGDDISVLNKVMIYVQENEITKKLKIVTVLKENETISESFLHDCEVLDRAYPDIKIEFIQLRGVFGPELIQQLCKEWNIPTNFMFISSPGNKFSHKLQDLGGVRLII